MVDKPKEQLKPSAHTPQSLGAIKATAPAKSMENQLNQVPKGLHPVSAVHTKFQHDARKSGTTFKGKPGAK